MTIDGVSVARYGVLTPPTFMNPALTRRGGVGGGLLALRDEQLFDSVGLRNTAGLFRGVNGCSGGDGDVADSDQSAPHALPHVDGANIFDEELAGLFGEKTLFDGNAVCVNSHHERVSPVQRDEQRHQQPTEQQMPAKGPPRGTHLQQHRLRANGSDRPRLSCWRRGGWFAAPWRRHGITTRWTCFGFGGNLLAALRESDQCHAIRGQLRDGLTWVGAT